MMKRTKKHTLTETSIAHKNLYAVDLFAIVQKQNANIIMEKAR